jgi:hypothetical protein
LDHEKEDDRQTGRNAEVKIGRAERGWVGAMSYAKEAEALSACLRIGLTAADKLRHLAVHADRDGFPEPDVMVVPSILGAHGPQDRPEHTGPSTGE